MDAVMDINETAEHAYFFLYNAYIVGTMNKLLDEISG
jgi:hypothetical protein